MTFHISEAKYDKLLEDMQEVVRKTILENPVELEFCAGFGPGIETPMRIGFESLLYKLTDNQMNDKMFILSAEIFDRLESFMIGFNAIKGLENYSIDDVVDACNTILDESLSSIISSKIDVDFQ